jgi:hypothetical protein
MNLNLSRRLLLPGLIVMASLCAGQEAADSGLSKKLHEHLVFNFQTLTYMTENGIMNHSLFNPDNLLAQIPQGEGTIELRPNLKWTQGRFMLMAKPRFLAAMGFTSGSAGKQSNSGDFFLQEWSVRVNAARALTVSYGREFLQWGPSMSISPSNPFFIDNGRDNPVKEIGGRDFLRAVYSPSSKYSVSYLWNTAQGRSQTYAQPFRKTHAVKFDYTPSSFNASVIVSKKTDAPPVVGGFLQATVSSALLLYAEGSAHRGTQALFPYQENNSATWQMADIKNGFGHIYSTAVVGGAYTLRNGSTLMGEYIANREGYSDAEAQQYYQLGGENSQRLTSTGPQAESGAATLGAALNPQLLMLRRNYLFFQFLRTNYRDRADFMVRYTANLDDGSGKFAAYATLNCTNHIQLFALGMVTHGSPNTEAARLVRHQAMGGIRIFIK